MVSLRSTPFHGAKPGRAKKHIHEAQRAHCLIAIVDVRITGIPVGDDIPERYAVLIEDPQREGRIAEPAGARAGEHDVCELLRAPRDKRAVWIRSARAADWVADCRQAVGGSGRSAVGAAVRIDHRRWA